MDALHPCRHVLIITAVAPQAHQVFCKLRTDGQRLFMRTPPNRPRSLLEHFRGDLSRRKLLENLLDSPRLLAVDQGLLELLQVDWRAVRRMNPPQFVARQNMK